MFPRTLLQYDSPRKAVHHSTKAEIETKRRKAAKIVPVSSDEQTTMGCSEILDILLPPRTAEEDGQFWYQCVSRSSGTSSDLLRLQEHLDSELVRKKAKEIGLCPVRSDLYDQCFEELIRQEVIACPQRGRLLRMIQLEVKMSISALETLYESSVAYGIKKNLMSCRKVSSLTDDVTKLMKKLNNLETEVRCFELQLPNLKETHEIKEQVMKQNWDNEETEMRKENEALLEKLMEFIEVSLEEEE